MEERRRTNRELRQEVERTPDYRGRPQLLRVDAQGTIPGGCQADRAGRARGTVPGEKGDGLMPCYDAQAATDHADAPRKINELTRMLCWTCEELDRIGEWG